MKKTSILRAVLAVAAVGVLAGCSAANAEAGSGSGSAQKAAAPAAATYTAKDLEAIVASVDKDLALGGKVMNTAETKEQQAKTEALGEATAGATYTPSECGDLVKKGLSGSDKSLDLAATVSNITSTLGVATTTSGKLPASLVSRLKAGPGDALDKCSDMTVTTGASTTSMKMSKVDVSTKADSTWAIRQETSASAGMSAETTIVVAVSGNLVITAMQLDIHAGALGGSSSAPKATPAQLVDAAIDAAKATQK